MIVTLEDALGPKSDGALGQEWRKQSASQWHQVLYHRSVAILPTYRVAVAPGMPFSQHPLGYKRLLLTLDGRMHHSWPTNTGAT
jgi:hypothetical protein